MFRTQEQNSEANFGMVSHCPSCNLIEDKSENVESSVPLLQRSRLLRLLRVQSATILLLYILLYNRAIFDLPLIFTCPLIFWDLIGLACTYTRFSPLPLEINLLLELIFLGCFVYLSYDYFAVFYQFYWEPYGLQALGPILSLLVSLVGVVYLYLDIRAYPTHWRYKRDYRKTKPLIAFTETGTPVAFFQPPQQTILQRLSIDSLQELQYDQNGQV
ncbi:hypothetical protein F4678DRAFT_52381 [Xylaria arbuscula]|nr:hypothetical protein F4678DRAFT_52381 [Xylaria arbuscula]